MKQNKKKVIPNLPQNDKRFSTTKLIYIILVLFIIGMVILYSSDTFLSLPKSMLTGSNQMGDFHKGADLSKLKQIQELEVKVNNNPEDMKSLLQLGHLYNDNGFYDKAVERYKSYLSRNPNEPDVLVDMGVCYFELNKFEDAIATMKKALVINPKHQIAHFNLGIVSFSSGQLDEAKNWWKKTIEINPVTEIAKKAEELLKSH